MIIDRFSHSDLAEGEEIIVSKFPWQFSARFSVGVPNNQLPSALANRMSTSFRKFNKGMDEAEKSNNRSSDRDEFKMEEI